MVLRLRQRDVGRLRGPLMKKNLGLASKHTQPLYPSHITPPTHQYSSLVAPSSFLHISICCQGLELEVCAFVMLSAGVFRPMGGAVEIQVIRISSIVTVDENNHANASVSLEQP